jgi:Right handed beta helix region
MLRRAYVLATIAFALSTLAATDAVASAQRTFVASTGNDANPCSLMLPCRAFAAAITLTIPGGEVIVLDSAGYGPVIITQSVSIIAPAGVYAGISVPASVTGVAIAGAAYNVTLRGLTINSTGGTGYGIRMTNGSELAVENCVISNFGSGTGVSIETSATVKIAGTVVSDNYVGIVAGYGATANITNSQIIKSTSEGIEINGGSSDTTNVTVTDTLVTGTGGGNITYCIDNFATGGTIGNMSITRVTVTNCFAAIDHEPSGTGTTTVSNSVVTNNGYGFYNHGGTFRSLGNNHVSGNAPNISGTITLIGGN